MGWSDIFGGGSSNSKEEFWKTLNSEEQLDELVERSKTTPVVIFKHSTRCSISTSAKGRLDRGWDFNSDEVEPYYLDLIQFRNISTQIAERFGIQHESPQLILLQGGKAVYNASHYNVRPEGIREHLVAK
jgi:bacillithiol system protein YtxJ